MRATRSSKGNLVLEVCLVLVAVCAAAVAGFLAGDKRAEARWQAKESQRVQAEASARAAEIRRGEKASGALQAELLQLQNGNDQLRSAFDAYKRRYPILARSAQQPAAAGSRNPAPAGAAEPVPAGGSPALSYGAVWMWNSALAGRDVPAGTCGLADTSEAACAADSGATVEDAWDNQARNARTCAEDRLRQQRLIDFINARKQ
jgi:hypothetical protein